MDKFSRRHIIRMILGAGLLLPSLGWAYTGTNTNTSSDAQLSELLRQADTPASANEVWVLIEDQQSLLTVYRGNAELARFYDVRIGRGGSKLQRVMGDKATPQGEFHVNRFNFNSKFDIFIGLDYPTPRHARMALESGLYTQQDYDSYFDYYRLHSSPPQETVLGGYIGIHGIGEGDENIHRNFNWTNGCVAVSNQEIQELASLIDVGTRVVIR